MEYCKRCGKELASIEIGLHKKLVNRGATEFLCVDCLGNHFQISPHDLLEKAEYYKNLGCTLFL